MSSWNFDFATRNVAVLTGAGFTKNLGGFLGTEMWAKIFNDPKIQNNSKLRQQMIDRLNFENAYEAVINDSELKEDEKELFYDSLIHAYESIDRILQESMGNWHNLYGLNLNGLCKFLESFSGDSDRKGFFFTLNQDLFIERYYTSINKLIFRPIPGSEYKVGPWNDAKFDFRTDAIKISDNKIDSKWVQDFFNIRNYFYIKIHGSYDWQSSDSKRMLIIGENKFKDLEKLPLLDFYWSVFQDVVKREKMKLLIIGYGWQDEHVNKAILKAVEKFGLRIYALSPHPVDDYIWPQGIQNMTEAWKLRTPIFQKGLAGYFQCTLTDVFPSNNNVTKSETLREIELSLKEENI
jgi:hypothetical protein